MDEDLLEQIVTRLENKLRAGWRAAMRDLKDESKLTHLEHAIQTGQTDAMIEGIDEAIASFTADLAAGYVYAGQRAARAVDDMLEEIGRASCRERV